MAGGPPTAEGGGRYRVMGDTLGNIIFETGNSKAIRAEVDVTEESYFVCEKIEENKSR